MPPFEIQVFTPSRTQPLPSRRALAVSALASEPASGSESEKAAIASPAASLGSVRAFCSALPARAIGTELNPAMAKAKSANPA